ncbi:MAG: response regulator [Marivirga sp.]|nr:response regulator [Marivirga sp.]
MKRTITILLVDDDEDDRNIFCEALQLIDPEIQSVTATDGLEALDFLKKCTDLPNFIFLDLNMPRMDGKQCLKTLKEDKRFEAIPVIIYSTSKMEEDVQEAMRLGAAHYIEKPVNFDDICRKIALVIKGKWRKHSVPVKK